jgi:hypothetical protein
MDSWAHTGFPTTRTSGQGSIINDTIVDLQKSILVSHKKTESKTEQNLNS